MDEISLTCRIIFMIKHAYRLFRIVFIQLLVQSSVLSMVAQVPVYENCISIKSFTDTTIIKQKNIIAENKTGNMTGATSIRNDRKKEESPNPYPEDSKTIFSDRTQFPLNIKRDRDLGQTFISSGKKAVVEKLFLRVGPNPVKVNTPGARIVIQFFRVEGTPALNDHGTPGSFGAFDRQRAPEMDDYLEGETYTPLFAATGVLPSLVNTLDFLEFSFSGKARLKLEANKGYAFLIMFAEPAEENRGLTLYNQYWGIYTPDATNKFVGHGIRREGLPFFPENFRDRLQVQPSTFGFPDVCTFRDLFFVITGK